MKKFIIFLIPFLFTFCQKDREAFHVDFSPEMQAKLDESKKIILSHIKDEYSISNGSKSPEDAIRRFLEKALKEPNLEKNPYFISFKERNEVIYPNTYGFKTSLDVTPLEDYNKLITMRSDMGYTRLRGQLGSNQSLKGLHIIFAQPRIYNKIVGLKPKVELKGKSHSIDLEGIKMVFKVGNSYKVGVIAP